jgi:hypothetical protein
LRGASVGRRSTRSRSTLCGGSTTTTPPAPAPSARAGARAGRRARIVRLALDACPALPYLPAFAATYVATASIGALIDVPSVAPNEARRELSAHEVSAVACPRGARLSGAAVPHRALRLSWEPAALYVMAAARQATARPPSSAEPFVDSGSRAHSERKNRPRGRTGRLISMPVVTGEVEREGE